MSDQMKTQARFIREMRRLRFRLALTELNLSFDRINEIKMPKLHKPINSYMIEKSFDKQTQPQAKKIVCLENHEHNVTKNPMKENDKFLLSLLDSIPAGVAVMTYPDLKILFNNKYDTNLCNLLGTNRSITLNDLVEKIDVYQTNNSGHAALEELPLLRAARDGVRITNEHWTIRFNNNKKMDIVCNAEPIKDTHGIAIGTILIWHELSNHSNDDNAIHIQGHLHSIENNIPFGIWCCGPGGEVRYVSQSFLDLLDMDLTEAQQFGWTKRMHPDDVGSYLDKWLHCIKTDEEWEHEIRIIDREGMVKTILNRGRPLFDAQGNLTCWIGINLDFSERKARGNDLNKIEWLLSKNFTPSRSSKLLDQAYGDPTQFNSGGEILRSVGKNVLMDIVSDFVDLLETSVVIFEKNGDHALSFKISNWCRHLDMASFEQCSPDSVTEAMKCGKWHCHDSGWKNAARITVTTGIPVDTKCAGGLHIYTTVIRANGEIIGAIGFGYGDPPHDAAALYEIAKRYHISIETITQLSKTYKSRPKFIIDIARNHLHTSARFIGSIVERKRAESALQKTYNQMERRIEERTSALTRSFDLLKEETKERLRAERELSHRQYALESVYSMSIASFSSVEEIFDRIARSISEILSTPFVAIGRVKSGHLQQVSQIEKGIITHVQLTNVLHHPCGIVVNEGKTYQIQNNLSYHYPRHIQSVNNYNSFVGVPIINKRGLLLGVICTLDKVKRIFSGYEIRLIEIFCRYAANEIERRDMEEQLRQAQEMKILGLLTSGVAHEVRNPLNGILAITEALANDLGDNPDYQPYVAHIKTQVTRLSDLMRDLLDLGRPIDKDNLLPTSIMWLISAALNSWHHSSNHSNRNIRVKADADANNWIVAAERARMQQVYINLFENACDHSPPESDVIIEVHKPNNYTIQVKIIDEGIGIKPEYFERLFEPFFTTRKEGTGLGLGIVKRIVESHGGSIIMYNNGSQRGCCVEIQLPLYDN